MKLEHRAENLYVYMFPELNESVTDMWPENTFFLAVRHVSVCH